MVGRGRPRDELQAPREVGAGRGHAPLPDVFPDVVQNLLLPFGEFFSPHFCSMGVDSTVQYWLNRAGLNNPGVNATQVQVYHGGTSRQGPVMRTKLLRCRNDVKVQLVYPSTLEEYRQVLDALGGASAAVASGESDSVAAGSRPRNAAYVVTTAQQRHLWGLPDLTVSGRAVPVDEARALDLLHDAAVNPDRAAELFPGRSPEVVSALEARTPGGSWFDAVRGFLSPGARVDQAVRALDRAGMPSAVHEALSDGVAHALGPGAEAAQAELDRVRVLLDLPWTKSEPQRFDTEHVAQVLRRTHAALDGVQARILRFLGSCPEARDCSPSRVRARAVARRRTPCPPSSFARDGLRLGPLSSVLPVPGGPARRRWRTRSRRLSAGSP